MILIDSYGWIEYFTDGPLAESYAPFIEKADVSTEELTQLRAIAGKYGLLDISCENIRSVNGDLKIIDAGIAPPRLFKLWKTADFITLRLPPPVRRALRKSRLLNTVRGR